MGRRRRSNCCDFSGQNFNSKCFTFFVTLKILVWCCIWIYLLKYYVFSDYEAIMTQNQSQSSLDNINNMDNMDNIKGTQSTFDIIMLPLMHLFNPKAICFVAFITIFVVGSLSI